MSEENTQPVTAPAVASGDLLPTQRRRRDELIRLVWMIMRDLSDHGADQMTYEDLDVWGAVTKHSAVQSRLKPPKAKQL